MTAKFDGGRNIAMKVPPHQYDQTVKFYRETLGLETVDGPGSSSMAFKFGANVLWIDRVPAMSQAELWLEVVADDTAGAARVLANAEVVRCDAIEALPDGFDGFWISNPCGIIHLVDGKQPAGPDGG